MGKEFITVERVGPYGVMSGGEWYGIGKGADIAPDDFKRGESYSVLVNKSQAGKKYINEMSPADDAGSVSQVDEHDFVHTPAPRQIVKPPVAKTWGATDPDTQDRISRNTAYQKATDSVSRLLTPFIAKEDDILPKLQEKVEEMAQWLYKRIKGEPVTA